ncbi:Zinc finger CCCH domain-containing protein 37 [Senna tora]|uniref:Zinc finger CCCH domain-containing protein 37 n=1 Tax=Senna tora TaxID=362788 RepID=A0A835CBZ0_9FABA|nr:Zinc finger CCCH domain-containing protein 37 [Senna tora]
MANQLYHYGYSPTNGGASPSSPAAAAVVGAATSLSSGRYLPTDMYFPQRKDSSSLWYPSYAASDIDIGPPGVATRNSTSAVGATSSTTSNLLSQASWPAAIAAAAAAANAGDPIATNMKRSSDALYHPTALLAHNTIGQSEAWYSTSSLTKRPRYENASNLPIYPQRPGEKDCAHYMLTRTCKFGDSCKFDHPIWVPEGGIPDWKEVPNVATETLPERPGEPDCPYFVKTQRCKFGPRCKFNHPKDLFENADVSGLPERPTEPPCAFYMKTGRCKFGVTCKFHHPRDIQIQLSVEQNGAFEHTQFAANAEGATGDTTLSNPFMSYTYPSLQNSKGLPIRLGEVDCPFYMKTGSCKYGATCRYNHPDWSVAGFGYSVLTSAAANLNLGIVNPAASIYQAIDPTLSNATRSDMARGKSLYYLALPCAATEGFAAAEAVGSHRRDRRRWCLPLVPLPVASDVESCLPSRFGNMETSGCLYITVACGSAVYFGFGQGVWEVHYISTGTQAFEWGERTQGEATVRSLIASFAEVMKGRRVGDGKGEDAYTRKYKHSRECHIPVERRPRTQGLALTNLKPRVAQEIEKPQQAVNRPLALTWVPKKVGNATNHIHSAEEDIIREESGVGSSKKLEGNHIHSAEEDIISIEGSRLSSSSPKVKEEMQVGKDCEDTQYRATDPSGSRKIQDTQFVLRPSKMDRESSFKGDLDDEILDDLNFF